MKRRKGLRGRKGERKEERGTVLLNVVSIKELNRLGMSIPKLRTVYFVHSAVVLCEKTTA